MPAHPSDSRLQAFHIDDPWTIFVEFSQEELRRRQRNGEAWDAALFQEAVALVQQRLSKPTQPPADSEGAP
ncbi:MAG: hypothetical protein HQM06_07190 [Magnetococcales bacterium]|nr:hypothetical protein [Magnetococcales bacterium]